MEYIERIIPEFGHTEVQDAHTLSKFNLEEYLKKSNLTASECRIFLDKGYDINLLKIKPKKKCMV